MFSTWVLKMQIIPLVRQAGAMGQSSDVCKMDTHFASALLPIGESIKVKVSPSSLVLLPSSSPSQEPSLWFSQGLLWLMKPCCYRWCSSVTWYQDRVVLDPIYTGPFPFHEHLKTERESIQWSSDDIGVSLNQLLSSFWLLFLCHSPTNTDLGLEIGFSPSFLETEI